MTRRRVQWLLALSLMFLFLACGDSSDNTGTAEDTTGSISVSNITFDSGTADAGHLFELRYDIEADADNEDVLVSFYLYSVDNPGENDSENQPKDYKELLGTDVIVQLLESTPLTRQVSFRVPGTLPDGEYYIDAYVNEHLDESTSAVRASSTVILDNSAATETKLRIVDVEIENPVMILDPYVDILRGLDVANLNNLQSALLDDPGLLAKALDGLVSEAEINGTVTVVVDGDLPTAAVTLAFEYSLDDGTTWNALEWWDNTAQSYANSVTVEFPDFENGTREQGMDFDINVPHAMYDELFTYITALASSDLEQTPNLMARLRLWADDVPAYTYELNMPLYIVPTSLADLAVIQGTLDAATAHLATLGGTPLSVSLASPSTKPLALIQPARADETADRVSEKTWSRWSGKKGKFKVGAAYEHKFAIYNGNPRTGYYGAYAKMAFDAPMYIFNQRFNIVSAYLRASAYAQRADSDELQNTGYQYYLDLFADTIFAGDQWAGSVTYSVNPSHPLSVRKMLAETWFWVGPIPFSVEAGVKGTLDYGISLNVDIDNGVTATTTLPEMALKLYVEGGPDVYVAEAGIGADLGLLNDTVTAAVNFDFTYDDALNRITGATYDATVVNDLKAIWGEFYLYYRYYGCSVTDGCRWKTRRRTIHDTDPYREWTYTLYGKSESLFGY
jgi:hypothetical protein